MTDETKDFRTPQATKWSEDYIPPATCGSIDDIQNALEHLRDANSQLRHAAHLWKHVAQDELRRRCALGEIVAANLSRRSPPSEGGGWQSVPVVPTLEMQHAYFDSIDEHMARVETDPGFGRYSNHTLAYRAMLSAAPSPPGQETKP